MKPTIIEICQAHKLKYPVSHNDLKEFVKYCINNKISCNIETCKVWSDIVEEIKKEYYLWVNSICKGR